MLDLLDGADTERTRLEMVRKKPLPFPPEPFAWTGIELTRRSLAPPTAARAGATSGFAPRPPRPGLRLLIPSLRTKHAEPAAAIATAGLRELAVQENLRIANCTTSGQYFHLLRRQALDATARPLVVMTPKGLLRLKPAGSTLEDLASGASGLCSTTPCPDRQRFERLVLCQGKIYYDIAGHEQRDARPARGGPDRAALPVPDRARAGRVRALPEPTRGRVGAGGAAEHGRWRAIRHRLEERSRRVYRSSMSAGRGARARARAIRPRTSASRTESSAPRSGFSSGLWRVAVAAAVRGSLRRAGRELRAVPSGE